MQPVIRPRILYADPNEEACLMLRTLLELLDIEVQTANSVAEAYRLAQNKLFDLYLFDTRFPDGSGSELCQRLREFDLYTPIVFYSGDGLKKNQADGLAAGANAYFVKPDFDGVVSTIWRLLK